MGGKHDSPVSGGDPRSGEAGAHAPFAESSPGGLTNHLLIAMPQLADPNFAQTVALICEHTDKGALGIVLNKPLPMTLSRCAAQMKLEPSSEDIAAQPVLRGGPVHTDRGFVLHRPRRASGTTPTRSRTPSRSPPRATCWRPMARGEGPSDAFIALGYAGWESGQLEREMRTTPGSRAGRCARGVRAAVRGALGRRLAAAGHRGRAAVPGGRSCIAGRAAPGHDRPETVLAFDFGLKRIGIASGDTLTRTARAAPGGARAAPRVPTGRRSTREVRALGPARLVVGAPYNADGTRRGDHGGGARASPPSSNAASRSRCTWSMSASPRSRRRAALKSQRASGAAPPARAARATSTARPRR